MTLQDTIRAIELVASGQPSVNMLVRSDIFRLNAAPDARYGVFAWLQNQHTLPADSSFINYSPSPTSYGGLRNLGSTPSRTPTSRCSTNDSPTNAQGSSAMWCCKCLRTDSAEKVLRTSTRTSTQTSTSFRLWQR